MTKIVKTWLGLKSDRRGVTALEYGLIAAVLATVVIGGFSILGNSLGDKFNNIATNLNSH